MKNKNTLKVIIIALLFISAIVTFINPLYPNELLLQHIGTLLLVTPLIVDLRKKYLRLSSFIGIALFTLIHIIGARYIYSYVPYNEWTQTIFNLDINTYFSLKRNHFDRFVHFSFGVLFFPYFIQLFSKWHGLSFRKMILVAWLAIQAFSMFYELFEWSLTLLMSSEGAENYNGQQGDMWDPHKDMALAMLGSTMMSFVYLWKNKKILHKTHVAFKSKA